MKARGRKAAPRAARSGATRLSAAVAAVILLAVGANAVAHRASPPAVSHAAPPTTEPPPSTMPPSAITAAANSLVTAVKTRANDDDGVPAFARERLQWLSARQRTGELSIVLLDNPADASLDAEALMASGDVDGRQVIALSRPRLARFLTEDGPASAPFSRRQYNDFLLGLVHETVHLGRPHTDRSLTLDARLDEEVRAWRAVDLHVVRPMLERREPMNPRFIDADNAIRSCGDKEPCQALRELLLPSERLRY